MIDFKTFRHLALSFPGTEMLPHFHLISFRYNKKIFATYHEKDNRAMLKLSPADQSVFCSYNKEIFSSVPGVWGKQGSTFVDLKKVRKDVFKNALKTAYLNCTVKKK